MTKTNNPLPLSVAELRALAPRKVKKTRSKPLRPMSEKQRAHNMSPENLARLRANIETAKARGGIPTRKGVPDGWAGPARRRRLEQVREQARQRATAVVNTLVREGVLDHPGPNPNLFDANGELNIAAAGRAALEFLIGIVLAVDPDTGQGAYTLRDRQRAASTVLEYTAAKVSHGHYTAVTATAKAESFLADLLRASTAPGASESQ